MSWIRKRSPLTRLIHALLLAALVGGFSAVCPTPYSLLAPGPIYEARRLVTIQGEATHPSGGRFLMPTVVDEPATLLFCVYGLLNPDARLVLTSGRPRAQSVDEDSAEGQMELSQLLAIESAFAELAQRQPERRLGLEVVGVQSGSPNAALLRVGDVITAVDGVVVRRGLEFGRALAGKKMGGLVQVEVFRAGQKRALELAVWKDNPRPILGFQFRPGMLLKGKRTEVQISGEHVVGASGGLVFCLEVLNQLLPDDLTRGRVIAATGTMDAWGTVGPIEGVVFKLRAAERAGAQVFLCPQENVAELSAEKTSVQVHAVGNLKDALRVLKELK